MTMTSKVLLYFSGVLTSLYSVSFVDPFLYEKYDMSESFYCCNYCINVDDKKLVKRPGPSHIHKKSKLEFC